MAKLKVKFHPLFWIFLVILLFSNNFISVFSYIFCVFLHELGHFIMASFLGYKLNKINFMPFGASLSGKENVFYKTKHEVLVSIAGPLTNLILLIISLALFWCFPVCYIFLEDFYFANLITLMFNLLPVYPLDGGRVINAIFKRKGNVKKAYKKTKIIGFIVCGFLFILFIVSAFYKINFTFGLTALFLIAGLFFEDTSCYYQVNFSFINKTKKLNLGMETQVLCVSINTTLYNVLKKLNKFKYNLINIVNSNGKIIKSFTESEIAELFINNNLSEKLENLI